MICQLPASEWLVEWQFNTRTGAFDCVNLSTNQTISMCFSQGKYSLLYCTCTLGWGIEENLFLDRWMVNNTEIENPTYGLKAMRNCSSGWRAQGQNQNHSHVNLIKSQVMIAAGLISQPFPSETSWRQLLHEDVIFTVEEVHGSKWNTASMRPWWVGIELLFLVIYPSEVLFFRQLINPHSLFSYL